MIGRCARIRRAAASSCSIRACMSRAPQTVVGKTYPDGGFEQGRAVLAALARHPATAEACGDQARAPFRRRRAAARAGRAAVASASSTPTAISRRWRRRWSTSPEVLVERRASKLKRPGEWLIGALRATGVTPPDIGPVMQAQNLSGRAAVAAVVRRRDSPTSSAAWLDGLVAAARYRQPARATRRRAASTRRRCSRALGPLASAETRQAIARAESRPQALALLLMSPEFQRR